MTCSPLQRIDLHPDRLRRQGGLQVQHLTRLEVVGDAADLPHGLIVCPKKTNGCHDIAIRTVRAIQHGAVPGASPRRIGKHLVATQNNILVGVGGGKAIEDQKRHPHEHTQPYPSRNDPCTPDDPRCELGLSTTRTGGHQTEIRSHILTLDVDTYVGAGQFQGAGQSEWWITSSGCRCANAMLRASSTHSVRRCEAIAHPTTRRLPASMTTARYRKALATGTSAPPTQQKTAAHDRMESQPENITCSGSTRLTIIPLVLPIRCGRCEELLYAVTALDSCCTIKGNLSLSGERIYHSPGASIPQTHRSIY
jgi:hypothetical protein